jgi:hypothetical protein
MIRMVFVWTIHPGQAGHPGLTQLKVVYRTSVQLTNAGLRRFDYATPVSHLATKDQSRRYHQGDASVLGKIHPILASKNSSLRPLSISTLRERSEADS